MTEHSNFIFVKRFFFKKYNYIQNVNEKKLDYVLETGGLVSNQECPFLRIYYRAVNVFEGI